MRRFSAGSGASSAPRERRAWFNLVNPVPLLGPLFLGKGHQRVARYMLVNFTSDQDAFSEEDIELFSLACANRPAPGQAPPSTATSSNPRPFASLEVRTRAPG
jgi:hypothetical protein